MKLRVFTVAYGDHVPMLEGLVASLGWPKNRKALEGAQWTILTDDIQKARWFTSPLGLTMDIRLWDGDKHSNLKGIAEQVRECVGGGLLTANPDNVFGDGTIGTLVKLASEDEGLCISIPHPRVEAENFPSLSEPTSNAQLVGHAMKTLHQGWASANMAHGLMTTYFGGVMWRDLGNNLYAVSCRLPSAFLVRPLKGDADLLVNPGDWDHTWPTKLVDQQRHRIVGSSDAAFVVELTPKDKRHVKLRPRSTPKDEYRLNLLHHRVNRNTISFWRAE